ncbi:hypothetical protein AUR64_18010 [Haloprofundus marisrubri]|uniref:DUF7344 domain-containing protein n=1 Tax=Haloprofundus marisrubri TaxID=1514971 RepID=A0A0W1R5N5_9EURY|nr:hypothetical protein [Haloprofundus marisrubri]KTG08571.1 hypothetical protein AUR64_18010 [Haloprofundus marisrubri]
MTRTETENSPADDLTEADIHDVLRNDRRRMTLERLAETGEETVRSLSEHIGARESGEDPPPRNVRQSVYISLHQTHLPKLDDLDIVDYDDSGKTVSLEGNADQVLAYMRFSGTNDAQTPSYALAIGVLGFLVALVWMLVPGVAEAVAAVVCALLFAVLTAYEVWAYMSSDD